MARTIAEIKQEQTDRYIQYPTIRTMYDLKDGKTFEDQFSIVSIESIVFYIVATAIWTLEKLFDIFKVEVETTLSDKKPHRLKWYRDKTLSFQKDHLLAVDSDIYTTIDEAAKVVKYAAAVETPDSSKLFIKIAGEANNLRDKLPDDVEIQVFNYLQWIKDAGVRIDLINQSPDHFKCEIDIHYNAMLLPDRVSDAVRKAITDYIENLPFNGEYSNMALIDALQVVDGVVIPELIESSSKPAIGDYNFAIINAKKIPDAGYLRAYKDTDIKINMIAYELVQD